MKTNKLWSIMMMLVLVLGTMVAFSSCSKNDDEDNNQNQQGTTVDMSKIIGHWSVDSEVHQELISFSGDGIVYEYDNLDDDNWEAVLATGSYTVNGNVVTAIFDKVSVRGNGKVMGFTDKTQITVNYTINKIETSDKETKMTLVNGINGKTLIVYKY